MNTKEILRKAGGILTELNEQYEYLSQNPESLNELELELFSANASFLSDHLAILVKLNKSAAKLDAKASSHASPVAVVSEASNPIEVDEKLEEKTEEKMEEKVETQPEPLESMPSDWKFELDREPSLTFDFEEKEAEKLFDRPLTEDEKRVINEKTQLREAREEEDAPREMETVEEVEPESATPAAVPEVEEDIFVKEVVISERTIAVPSDQVRDDMTVPTVNDLLSRSVQQKTVSSQFSARQVKDLKGMISLNDKLLFVRDLFNGYSLAYSEALELLNRFDNFEAADNFLKQNYAAKNNWSAKQDVADKFYEILSRRFS